MANPDLPFSPYADRNGSPLNGGYLYFGEPGLNPATDPVTVYWDELRTQPASQPIRTIGGYPSRNGQPSQVFVSDDYSRTVQDSHGNLILYQPNVNPRRSLGDASWVQTVATGIFDYLRSNAQSIVASDSHGIGFSTFSRTSDTGGLAGEFALSHAAFTFNDKLGGSVAGALAFYGTAVRGAGVLGATATQELDIANWGATIPLYPSAMFPAGQTQALWLASGGESTATPGLCGIASAAIGIISNDVTNTAQFEKGIVFQNHSIYGADGTGGTKFGCAIAFAAGHQMTWFNNTTGAVGEIVTSNIAVDGAMRLDFGPFGLLVQDRNNGKSLFLVDSKPSVTPANYIAVAAAIAGVDPLIEARGDDAALNLIFQAKGTGYVGSPNAIKAHKDSAIPAGGSTGHGFLLSSAANFGLFAGSGVPTLSAAKGSHYLRSDGSGVNDRAYINTDGATGWTAVVTVA